MTRPWLALVIPPLAAGCSAIAPEDLPAATPQRPTFSSNTQTAVRGTSELELGVGVGSKVQNVPLLWRAGATDDLEVFLGGDPYRQVETDDGETDAGFGDVLFGVRQRVRDEEKGTPAFAYLVELKLPTAGDVRGSGESNLGIGAIADKTFGSVTTTGYYRLGLLGIGSGVELAHLLALAADLPVSRRAGVFGELAGRFAPSADDPSSFVTLGMSFRVVPALVLDAGVVLEGGTQEDTRVFVGFTRNLGYLPPAD